MNFFGTEKYFQNRSPESIQRFEETVSNASMRDWFMTINNRAHLKATLTQKGINYDSLELLAKMGVWARKNKIHEKYSTDYNTTANQNYTVVLSAINQQFIHDMQGQISSFDKPLDSDVRVQEYKNKPTMYSNSNTSFNDIEDSETVIQDGVLTKSRFDEPDHEVYEIKKSSMMTAADMQNLDVYDVNYDRDLYTQTIGLCMKRQRRNNMQKYMHKRHIYGYHEGEGNADGYRSAESERASLDNLSRGFDMSKFRKYANNAKRPESAFQFQN